MTDRERVINGLQKLHGSQETMDLLFDAIVLLKEQEAVKPRVSTVEQRCGNCNKVIEMDGWKACPWCGKPILWEAVGKLVK